ncbi:uncharacterized protein LOC131655590 [Vicia villosa]|uniref:uncharacterized protein LOC131655590 n=1 Tax=Vicia villosa TaxID=3911 RepID=UPI00273AD752|nr:uncharacterized protein LOC131655590 [Vicia villosa]
MVPLVEEVVEDSLIWKDEQNGIYSVRPGYRLWRKSQANMWNKMMDGWRAASLSSLIEPRIHNFNDAQSFILDICSRGDIRDADRFAVMMDEIWKNRNNIVWNDTREEATKIGLQVYFHWHDWFLARGSSDRAQGPPPPIAWTPPNEGKLKCNVDASYNNSLGLTNRGWCVRNNVVKFIVVGVAWDYGILPTIVAEAMALKEAMQGAILLQLPNVIF